MLMHVFCHGAVEIGETKEFPMNYEATHKLFLFSKSILSRIKYVLFDYNRVVMSKDPFLVMVSRMIDKRDPCQRKRKVDNLTCLECIITFIKVSIPWRMLPQLMHLDCSYTTIYKRYAYWVNNKIIECIWKELLGVYQSTQQGMDSRFFNTLFIDSSHIRNAQGMDCTGYNALDRNRHNTKISCVCDAAGIVLSCQFYPSNYSDCLTTEEAVAQLVVDLSLQDMRRRVYLVGDKGYISKRVQEILSGVGITLLTPFRKNMKKQTVSRDNKKRLKARIVVEHLFCHLDRYRRFLVRFEHDCKYFESFHQLAFIEMMKKYV